MPETVVFYYMPDHRQSEGKIMKTRYTVALSVLAGAVLGAAAIQGLHAQAKAPAFVVAEIDVTNQDGFVKEFAPVAVKALAQGAGYKAIARGGKTVSIEGAAPKSRIVINHFDSMDEAIKAYNSPAYKEARKIGDKFGTFRIYATEGVAQ
jgi:uncharacterized protein (DUF1330 family)